MLCLVSVNVLHHSKGLPYRGAAIARFGGVTETANVQRNLGLDFVTKQHKSSQKLQPVYSLSVLTDQYLDREVRGGALTTTMASSFQTVF